MEEFLLNVRRPAQYIGGEWNSCKKDLTKAEVKFALCFPDLYEIGMSNLGIRILYDIINKLDFAACERFFSPDCDMEKVLLQNKLEIFSQESAKGLREFDIIGFSLGYELCYTNVLNILELGHIPLQADLRDQNYPLVIGGGPSVMNPEPMHEFFDLFFLGEAEEGIIEVLETYRRLKDKFKESKLNKEGLLLELSRIEGVYAPSLYNVSYDEEGKIREFAPKFNGVPVKIKKRFVKDLDKASFPVNWMVPYIQTIHDRIPLEIMRGCPNTCRFCQARSQYFPFRQRKAENVIELALEAYKKSGYEELSLMGLSSSDYYNLGFLLEKLVALFREKGVSISLPSIKPTDLLGGYSALIATIKKTSLTLAPEAATERMRKILNKNFDEAAFFKTIEQAYNIGYQHLKLYFMIGLPFEETVDLDKIIEFSGTVSELRRKAGKGPALVNISINTVIPKPHTPLQWFGMEKLADITEKQAYLKRKLKNRRLKLDCHNAKMSFLEGVLSRGDRRLSGVILKAFTKGARFDAWGNYFLLDRWLDSFKECGIDPEAYLKERDMGEYLPWDILDVGISKETLIEEAKKIKFP